MVIEAQINPAAAGDDIPGGTMLDGQVVDEFLTIIEPGEQIVIAGEIKSMVAGAMQGGI